MQLNLPLLLAGLSGIVFARKSLRRAKPSSTDELPAKGLLWLGWCILAWALAASVYPGVAQLTAVISNRLRYAFRLINVQNWGLLLVTLAWCWLYALRGSVRRGVRNRVWLPALCTALLAVSSIVSKNRKRAEQRPERQTGGQERAAVSQQRHGGSPL